MNSPFIIGKNWHSTQCYGCGEDNEHSLKIDIRFDKNTGEVRFTYNPRKFDVGAPGYMHGGALATILDEAQGALCFYAGHLIMTDRLHLKYHKAVPLEKIINIRCWITAVRRRRMYTRGSILNSENEVIVSSNASWYLLPERIARRMFPVWDSKDYESLRLTLNANRKEARTIRKRLLLERKRIK